MTKRIRIPAAVALLLAFLLSPAAAAAGGEQAGYQVMTAAAHFSLVERSAAVLSADHAQADSLSGGGAVSKRSAFIGAIQTHMLQRQGNFSVHYDGPLEEIYTNFSGLMDEIYAYGADGNSSAGDYLKFSCKELGADIVYDETECDFTFHVTYHSTAAQEDYVDRTLAVILKGLNLSGADNYTQIKTVYDYVCTHFSYDETLTKFTAYDGLYTGKMVCQGYALLLYKMLYELDLPVRIIPGANHVWNLVCLGGKWYNLDATWDAGDSTQSYVAHRFFLKNQKDFLTDYPEHAPLCEYTTGLFNSMYPMAAQSFLLSEPVGCVSLSGPDTVLKGGAVRLSPEIYPTTGADAPLTWSSSNESVARVDQTGAVTAVGAGTAVITAAAADGAAAEHRVTVADFSAADSWCREELAGLYDTGIIPAGLLGNYQTPITRAEFVALLVRACESRIGTQAVIRSPFWDVGLNQYEREICVGYELGIVKGKSDVRFAPDDPLTRQEAAKLLCGALSVLEGVDPAAQADLSFAAFADREEIGSWALPYVAYGAELGILKGNGGRFYPLLSLTREQGMALVCRLMADLSLGSAA